MSVLTRKSRPPDRTLLYGHLPDQCADFYRATTNVFHAPSILFIHGGFWRTGYDRVHARPLASALANFGYNTLSIEYRRIPGNPDASVSDVRAAIQKLPTLLCEEKLTTNSRIIVIGHSAGGHLALCMASEKNVAGILPLAPVCDLVLAEALNLGNGAVNAFLGRRAHERPDLDPINMTMSRVPVEIIHGKEDGIVPVLLSRY